MSLNFENLMVYYLRNEKEVNNYQKELKLSDSSTMNLYPIRKWLQSELNLKNGKDNHKSAIIRQLGNKYFKEKNLKKSIESYNQSMCCAKESSEEFFLASANRSAATFELGKFEDCLKDIELCLNSSVYPEKLKPKIFSRKMSCLNKLGTLINNNSPQLPSFEKGENPNFAYASSKIDLKYENHKGRYVVAKESISKGTILFIEKAFAFGGIFDENSRIMDMSKCYYCLKTIYSGIPCNKCAKCIFCNSDCRDESWEQSHRWECKGMLGDVWYHLGIAFPAFRALLKGIVFANFEEIQQDNTTRFGSRKDNYPFFNSLVYDKYNNQLEVSIMAAIVSVYLEEYTDFFDWLHSKRKFENFSTEEIVKLFELLLSKHILQFQNNSSIIEHWVEEEVLPLVKKPTACGIFPSVSMMNHSCKPNITNYFMYDTIIVKALVDIAENEEINNCYGIYYRNMCRSERQKNCLQLYNFQCKCVICSDPKKETDLFDKFICPDCGFDLPVTVNIKSNFLCRNCGKNLDYKILMNVYRNIENVKAGNDLKSLNQSFDIRKKFLKRCHTDLQNMYFELYHFHKDKGNYKVMLEYFEEWYRVEKEKVEQDVQLFGVLLYELSSYLLTNLDSTAPKNTGMILKAKEFMKEAKEICKLHYPPHIVDRI